MKFLIYKLYQIALTQEKSMSVNYAFLLIIFAFEILHLLIIGIAFKISGFQINSNVDERYFGVLAFMILSAINYYIFIKTKKIYAISIPFKNTSLAGKRGNLLFASYIVVLFVIMYLEVFLYQNR